MRMRHRTRTWTCLVVLAAAAPAAPAMADTVVEAETDGATANNSAATAQVIAGSSFTVTADPNVYGGSGTEGSVTGLRTASITGFGGGDDVDFYSFTLTSAGVAWFDTDLAAFDTIISLFDASGVLIAYNDDQQDSTVPPSFDPGSSAISPALHNQNSLLGSIALAAGTYRIAVTRWIGGISNFPSAAFLPGVTSSTLTDDPATTFLDSGEIVSGASANTSFAVNGAQPVGSIGYTLHITSNGFGVLVVPEPGTWALFGAGVAGLAGLVRRRRTATRPR